MIHLNLLQKQTKKNIKKDSQILVQLEPISKNIFNIPITCLIAIKSTDNDQLSIPMLLLCLVNSYETKMQVLVECWLSEWVSEWVSEWLSKGSISGRWNEQCLAFLNFQQKSVLNHNTRNDRKTPCYCKKQRCNSRDWIKISLF